MKDSDKFHLKVASKEGVLYEGDVLSASSYNEIGKFDVLGQHANFISLISKGLIIRDSEGRSTEISFDNALLRVKDNTAEVYVGVEGLAPLLPGR